MNERCDTVLDIRLRCAEGLALEERERAIVEDHLRSCSRCRDEQRVLDALATPTAADTGDLDELSRRRLNDAVLAEVALRQEMTQKRFTSRRRVALAAGAGLLVASVTFVVVYAVQTRDEAVTLPERPMAVRPLVSESEATQGIGVVMRLEGRMRMAKTPVTEKDTLYARRPLAVETGRAMLELPAGIGLVVEPETELSIERSGERAFEVHLKTGELLAHVDPAVRRDGFEVVTRHGRVTVKGTVFSVTASGSATSVSVLRGVVAVEDAQRKTATVRAGETRRLGAFQNSWIPIARERALRETLANLEDASAPSRTHASAGDMGPPVSTISKRSNEKDTPQGLLNRARERRSNGDFRGVRDAYKALVQTHPTSNEAAIARISLGEVELNHLDNPSGALKWFDQYLARKGGALEQEALYGRCRALGALGRAQEENRCLEQFVARFPDALQSARIQEKLSKKDRP